VTPDLAKHVAAADIHPEVMGSDHCPISLILDL
jgi:exonuclease III